jgi:type IV pilus assembly protein PilA
MNTLRPAMRRQRPNGFTLMELLIVISIMLILMLLAIPNFNKIRMRGNETSAINSLQAITRHRLYTRRPIREWLCLHAAGAGRRSQAGGTSHACLFGAALPAICRRA